MAALFAFIVTTGIENFIVYKGPQLPKKCIRTLSALLFLLIFFFARPLTVLLDAQGEVLIPCVAYLRGYAFAAPPTILLAVAIPLVQMEGGLQRLLLAVVIMTGGDIVADLLNVLVFHGGMFGMALATAISYFLAFLVVLPRFFWKTGIFRMPKITLDLPLIREMLFCGFPSTAAQFDRLLTIFILNRALVMQSGDLAVAAYAVIINAGNLLLVPGSAIGDTTQLLGGVLNGEEDRRGIVDLFGNGLGLAICVNAICIVVFECLAPSFTGLFMRAGAGMQEIAVTGFRFYVLCLVFYAVNCLYRCFSQGSGQTKLSLIITLSDCLVCPLVCFLVMLFAFGVPAVWLGQPIGEGILTFVLLFTMKRRNKGCSGAEALIPFPDNFGADIHAVFDYRITEANLQEVCTLSDRIRAFCREHGADEKTAFQMALAIEDSAGNVIEHGFADGKKHSIEIRVLRTNEGWILRSRDNCTLFDPTLYLEQYTGDDPAENLGLKMLRASARDIVYLNTLSLNNLMVII